MYIAYNGAIPRGYFLGDVCSCIKTAWTWAETEPYDRILLSLHSDPFTHLWWRFIREHEVTVLWDHWPPGDQRKQYDVFDARRETRVVHDHSFDVYKELYPRMDGGLRQTALCGGEKGLGKKNIFEYYYFGQESYRRNPGSTRSYGRGIIDMPPWRPPAEPSVFVAPWEKCHGNRVFTIEMWQEVIERLVLAGVQVTLNDNRGIQVPEGVRRVFPGPDEIAAEICNHSVVASGNAGIGWLAGAGGYPIVTCERGDMMLSEYSFERSGFESVKAYVYEPDAIALADHILKNITCSNGQK